MVEVLKVQDDMPTQIVGSKVLDWRCLIKRDSSTFTIKIKSQDLEYQQVIGSIKVKLDLVPRNIDPIQFIDK